TSRHVDEARTGQCAAACCTEGDATGKPASGGGHVTKSRRKVFAGLDRCTVGRGTRVRRGRFDGTRHRNVRVITHSRAYKYSVIRGNACRKRAARGRDIVYRQRQIVPGPGEIHAITFGSRIPGRGDDMSGL